VSESVIAYCFGCMAQLRLRPKQVAKCPLCGHVVIAGDPAFQRGADRMAARYVARSEKFHRFARSGQPAKLYRS